jgi:hypothetical protein
MGWIMAIGAGVIDTCGIIIPIRVCGGGRPLAFEKRPKAITPPVVAFVSLIAIVVSLRGILFSL